MDETTHIRAARQALRLRDRCASDVDGHKAAGVRHPCVAIVRGLLERDDLTPGQVERLEQAAVILGRYGVGCARCTAAILEMPLSIQDRYRATYGPIPPACSACRDTGIIYNRRGPGLVCLACKETT